jgi:hypothetical protein
MQNPKIKIVNACQAYSIQKVVTRDGTSNNFDNTPSRMQKPPLPKKNSMF